MALIDSFDPHKSLQNIKPRVEMTKSRRDRMFKNFFFCLNESCIDTFESEDDLQMHILLNQHTTKESCFRSKDKAKLALFEKIKSDHASYSIFQPPTSAVALNHIPRHFEVFTKSGCALRTRKPPKPIDKLVKAFINSIFEEEKIYGE